MQIQHLQVFYEVAKAQSIVGASRNLRITQPALSRTIQQLEQALGRKLFFRQARGVALTAEGREVFERCRVIFAECAAIERKTESLTPLKVAASENLCLHVIPKLMKGATPEAEIFSGTAKEVVAAVAAGKSDVGFCYHPARAPGVFSKPLGAVEFVVVHARSWKVSRLKDLEGKPFIGSFSADYSGPFAARSILSQLGIAGKTAIQCNSQEAQVAMAEQGLGYTVVPWFVAEPRLKGGRLRKLKVRTKLSVTLFSIARDGHPAEERQQKLEEAMSAFVQR